MVTALSDTVRLLQREPRAGPHQQERSSIDFIDDYNAWVTGPSAAGNTRKLQTQLLPRTEKWAREGGAIFEADKTASS
jgi:hypothetical protein